MADTTETSVKKARMPMKLNTTVMMGVLLVVALAAAAFFWNESREANSKTDEAIAARNAEESNEVVANLNKTLLTESEAEPTVARVEEPQLLRDANPDFYKNVEVGDYLVLYPQRAIIFRNTEKRIINVAPIIDTSQLNTDGASDTSGGNSSEE